ncbi:hypothetical protein HHL17_31340 [Chitinophaga sp. G-6-1-13]|uniref:DUF4595 domain-containing protein n=1 Tax=Chitinophaga fulva TaxID=2728842 RepID=A0A848GWX0_9BACT|nr:hypothetical protein [Chitinophaga fulva]NML41722.1 hypothetical protein [Chitinophaga fulva]
MPYLRTYGISLLAAILLLTHSCQCKKEHVDPPQPPAQQQENYLVTAIRINGTPKDSLVYNNQLQLTERWDYNTSYRQWQNYTAFMYNADGYLKLARHYNENDNTLKSLSQKDSLGWAPGRLTVYTTYYRNLGDEISGYDTTRYLQDDARRFSLIGYTDTLPFFFGRMMSYEKYFYDQQDIRQYHIVNYVEPIGLPPTTEAYQYDMTYGSQPNPLYRYLSKNPLLLRMVTADLQNNIWKGYPFLASEHYVTSIRYETATSAAVTIPVTYFTPDTMHYPQEQRLASGTTISYRYRIVKQ